MKIGHRLARCRRNRRCRVHTRVRLGRTGISSLALLAATLLPWQPLVHAEGQPIKMTLRQAVEIAVSKSRAMRIALISRQQDRNGLRVADHEFRPSFDVSASALTNGTRGDGDTTRQSTLDGGVDLRLPFRTGGSLSYQVTGSLLDEHGVTGSSRQYGHALTLSQPLLRGRGEAATASQRLARLSDQGSELGLSATVSDIIDSTVFAYRDLLTAREEVKIAERSLKSSRDLATITKSLIEAGRVASVEQVQAETDIANQQLQVLVARNSADQAELALVSLLDLPLDTSIDPVDPVSVKRREIDPDEALRTLLAQSPEYRQQLLSVQAARISVQVARNGRWPDIEADASLRQGGGSDAPSVRDWSLGLTFQHVFGDPSPDVDYVDARLSLAQAQLALAKQEETLRIELRQQLRNLDVAWRQVELATRARELSERQLDIEREKLRAGRSTSFQVVRFQDDLQSASIGELEASIAYANQLTTLDRALGRTLDEWGVDPERSSAAADLSTAAAPGPTPGAPSDGPIP